MELLLVITVGCLAAAGLYMLMRRSMIKIALGLALLSHASHLLLFTARGVVRAEAPLIAADRQQLEAPYADPLPQAMILTAIVISFGLTAFTVGLIYRSYRQTGTDDLDEVTKSQE
jgi:multicomponent Na+:H+ antiporter subunit C